MLMKTTPINWTEWKNHSVTQKFLEMIALRAETLTKEILKSNDNLLELKGAVRSYQLILDLTPEYLDYLLTQEIERRKENDREETGGNVNSGESPVTIDTFGL